LALRHFAVDPITLGFEFRHGKKDTIFEYRLGKIDLDVPAGIIQRTDPNAVCVLPVAIALRGIPSLEFF
jgi:hypothetical protein